MAPNFLTLSQWARNSYDSGCWQSWAILVYCVDSWHLEATTSSLHVWIYQEAIVLAALWTRAGLRFFFNGFCEDIARESLPSAERCSEPHPVSCKLEVGLPAEQVGIAHPSVCVYVLSAMPGSNCGDMAGGLPL